MGPLELLLDAAAEALLAGDLRALSQLTPQIEACNLAAIDRGTAEVLRAKAQRNARLLDAATRGVKAARVRVAEITRGPTLTTYNAQGQKSQYSPQGPESARRV
jgi:hypothetical protein